MTCARRCTRWPWRRRSSASCRWSDSACGGHIQYVEAAHPLDDGPAILVRRSVEATADQLGRDAATYRRMMTPLVSGYQKVLDQFLGPFKLPRHPLTMAYFGAMALFSARGLARLVFRESRARAIFAGMAAHAIQPLERPITASFGLMLGMLSHAVGWPVAQGGSQRLADGLAAYLCSLGGEIVTGLEVTTMADLPPRPRLPVRCFAAPVVAIARRALSGWLETVKENGTEEAERVEMEVYQQQEHDLSSETPDLAGRAIEAADLNIEKHAIGIIVPRPPLPVDPLWQETEFHAALQAEELEIRRVLSERGATKTDSVGPEVGFEPVAVRRAEIDRVKYHEPPRNTRYSPDSGPARFNYTVTS